MTAKLSSKFYERFGDDIAAEVRAEMVKSHEGLLRAMEATRADLHKWMFVYWSGSTVGLGGLIVGMQLFSPR